MKRVPPHVELLPARTVPELVAGLVELLKTNPSHRIAEICPLEAGALTVTIRLESDGPPAKSGSDKIRVLEIDTSGVR